MAQKADQQSALLFMGFLASLAAMGAAWHFGVRSLVPPAERIDLSQLLEFLWNGFSNQELAPTAARAGQFFLAAGYPWYFALSVLPGVVVFGGTVVLAEGKPAGLKFALIGFLGGAVIGGVLAGLAGWWAPGLLNPFLAALAAPGLGGLFGYLGACLALSPPGVAVVRGTAIREHQADTLRVMNKAIAKGRTVLAGLILMWEAETRHVVALGVTGSGKSTAIRGLMYTAMCRGDRHVVADPDGSAMRLFWRPGDVILNPFDVRSVRWDALAELREETDYRFLGEAVLPPTGGGTQDEWLGYAREIFIASLRSWHRNGLGSAEQFFDTLATAEREKLALLCEGTAAQHYFAAGNERMLGSILGTMAPRVEIMRQAARVGGAAFSVRNWIRAEGRGTLWLPYQAHQIAALRELISCWMGLAITEVLAVPDSATRRIWFHLDEFDALGPLQGLKDAQARLRKKGGCVVIGLQSIDQVRAVYGAAAANTIIENCGNVLILRCGASERGGTAQFTSELIGEREVEHDETTTSRSKGKEHTTSSTSRHVRRRTEKAVLPSQIMQLADRSGYLRLAGEAEWKKVRFDYVPFQAGTEPYMPAPAPRREAAE